MSNPKLFGDNTLLFSKVKDIHRKKTPSNKTPALTKSTNMRIWVVVTLNQVYIRGS